MTKINLPISQNGAPIQAVSFNGDATTTAVGAGSASIAFPTGTEPGDIIRVAATTDCYITFSAGAGTATSSDHLFPTGVEYMSVQTLMTNLNVLRVSADGFLTVTLVD